MNLFHKLKKNEFVSIDENLSNTQNLFVHNWLEAS